jgi:D-alanyl-D-alanine carboxypeptidase/D-alanyl-D-alanine-endopeptidase (penicillin-binding protein 4)
MRHRAPILVLLLLSALPSCARQPRPVTAPVAPPVAPAAPVTTVPAPPPAPIAPPAPVTDARTRDLATSLETLLDNQALERSTWGVVVQSLENGEFLYRRNATKLLMPASNMKIVTLATTAERLGWDYTFETRLVTTGEIENGVLRGDLVVVGGGDPTFNRRHADPAQTFDAWVAALRAAGITAIEGRIVGDDRTFQRELLGTGWAWDYLAAGYAAPVCALELNEDTVDLVIRPGRTEGEPASVAMRPPESGMTADNRIVTGSRGTPVSLDIQRLPGSPTVHLSGSVPAGNPDITRTVAVDNPAEYFARVFRASLIAGGIAVRGEAVDVRTLAVPPDVSSARLLVSNRSLPLAEIAKVLMKVSQNLYGETLLRTMGVPAEAGGVGSVNAGRKVERGILESWGIAPDSFVVVDGSGLSRYNYLTAELLVSVLRRVYEDPRLHAPFIETLPIAGVDGTIASRFKGTRAAGNVRAKTGSIANARALSGYVQTLDGEMLVFSILANNFNVPASAIDATTDLVVERLANFTRK